MSRAKREARDREVARDSRATARSESGVMLTDEQAKTIVALCDSAAAWCDHYAGLVQIDNRVDLLRLAAYEAERDRYRVLALAVLGGWPGALDEGRPVDLLEAITHGELS